ncbi:MAG: M24 family metallopeptidase [Lentisphaeria bacterium]|nr:M24 family metallopeptidase [Lentisphaeria bacterium]
MLRLGKLMISSGETNSDMRYACGVSTPDDIIWFSADAVKAIVASALEYDRVKSERRSDTAVFSDSEFGGPKHLDIVRNIALRYRLDGFTVPGDFPLLTAEKLRESGLVIEPQEGDFFPEREFKELDEVEKITRSLRIAEAGCRRAFEVLRESDISKEGTLIWQSAVLTSEILRSEIDCTMLKLGCLPTGTICAGAVQGSQPHNQGSGALYANTPIVMDIFPRSATTGYWGDLTRTVVRGRAGDIVKKAYDAVFEARELAKEQLCAGANPSEIHNLAASSMESKGFYTGFGDSGNFGFFHSLGHGVGLDIHENPRLSPRNPEPLKGGEVVTIEPGLYYAEWGGIRLEDMAYIPEKGKAVILTEIETFLEL